MKVLIADTDAAYSVVVSDLVESLGMTSHVVSDGEMALESLTDGSEIAILFADMELPKLDGLELLRLMKGDEKLKNLPVVMLSQTAKLSDICTAIELGAARFLPKPFNSRHIERFLRELCL